MTLEETIMSSKGSGLIIGQIEDTTSILTAIKNLFEPSIPAETACEQFFGCFQRPRPKKLLRLNKPPHIAVFAPTGAGKGASFVVPFLFTCRDSCVVVDVKSGELARLTADARRRMGHEVYLLDPFREVTKTPATLNVLDFVDKDSPFAIDDCREIASAIVDRTNEKGDNSHFLDNAEAGIASNSALMVQYGTGKMKSLQGVCDICSSPDNWQLAIKRMCESDAWDKMLARMGGDLTHLKERELASSLSTIARFLRFLSTPTIAESTRSSSFNPADLKKKKMTVYLILPTHRAEQLSQLLRLWMGAMLRGVVKEGLQRKTTVHFVIDEANLVGNMPQLSQTLTIGRGFGAKLQLYYQDMGQLKKCWPDRAEQTLLANTAQVYFAVNDYPTAKAIEDRLGKYTQIIESGGTGSSASYQGGAQGQGSQSYSNSSNDNWAQNGRELAQASEILNWHDRIAVTFTPGVPPIWTTLVRYYEAGFESAISRVRNTEKPLVVAVCSLILLGFLAFATTKAMLQNSSPEGYQNSQPNDGYLINPSKLRGE